MSFAEGMSPADIAAISGDGFGNGAWWIILLFLLWGRGGYGNESGNSIKDQYTLASDFATIQRQLSDGFGAVESKGDTINNGLCSGFYENARISDGISTNILTTGNAIQSQLAQCCCDNKSAIADVKYAMAQNTNTLQNAVQTGFCQTNFNAQNNTRDIIDAQNANTRAILDALQANKVEALKDRIAEQNQMINSLNLAASQARQNEYLVNQLRPCPVPAYITCNPYASSGCGCA